MTEVPADSKLPVMATRGCESGTLGVRPSPRIDGGRGAGGAGAGGGGSTGSTPVIPRRVDHVHILERKNSSGDLHSRLKTRKLLGVGETDDGDVHRSKLSQILGHSEQLFVRLPRGLRVWQLFTAIMFSTLGCWALIFPCHMFSFVAEMVVDASAILPIRMFGGALLTLSIIFWYTLQSMDKDILRWSLMMCVVYCVIQLIVAATWVYHNGLLIQKSVGLLVQLIVFGTMSLGYYWAVGLKGSNQHSWIRRVNSNSDVNKCQ